MDSCSPHTCLERRDDYRLHSAGESSQALRGRMSCPRSWLLSGGVGTGIQAGAHIRCPGPTLQLWGKWVQIGASVTPPRAPGSGVGLDGYVPPLPAGVSCSSPSQTCEEAVTLTLTLTLMISGRPQLCQEFTPGAKWRTSGEYAPCPGHGLPISSPPRPKPARRALLFSPLKDEAEARRGEQPS